MCSKAKVKIFKLKAFFYIQLNNFVYKLQFENKINVKIEKHKKRK